MTALAEAANARRKTVARMDARLLTIQAEFAPVLADLDTLIADQTAALQGWAETNPELFAKRKSLEFANGRLGFQTSPPKVALLSRAWNWDKVLDAILRCAFQFVRVKQEVDKDAILAFYALATDKPQVETNVLRPIGVQIKQDEGFFIEPKLTEVE